MKTLPLDLGDRSYPIYIGAGLLDRPELLSRHILGTRVAIVTNETVAPLYLARLARTPRLPQQHDEGAGALLSHKKNH